MFTPSKELHNYSSERLDKHFISLLDALGIRHSYYDAFEAFLDCAINSLSMNYSGTTMESIRNTFSQDERYMLGEMIHCWVFSCNLNVTDDNSFHDFLGLMYERNAMSKQKGFAQYFTPENICRLIAGIVGLSEKAEAVAEPACGSGRLNLAVHACNHRLLHHANDLDYTCAKMATLNFFIHGIKGVVTCDDGLFPGRAFKGAFAVNFGDSPNIQFIEDAATAYMFIRLYFPGRPQDDKDECGNEAGKVITPSAVGEQLSLFSRNE